MKENDNGKWNLDDLVKNPSKQIFDKKIKAIEKDAGKFEKQKNGKSRKSSRRLPGMSRFFFLSHHPCFRL